MAILENTSGPPKKFRHDKLAAIIRDRLELHEDWFPVTDRPSFFDKIKRKDWHEFETAFKRVVDLGCRWDVLLTCLARYDTYNTDEIVLRQAEHDCDGELSRAAKTVRQPMSRPPGRDERESIRSSLDGASGKIKRYENLFFELGQFDAPPTILGPHLSADEALVYLPKLLKWCGRLLSEDSLGNFRTVESAGRLVPCVYVDLLRRETKPASSRAGSKFLQAVADLIHEIRESDDSDHAELREALTRFERRYPSVYRQLRAKIEGLHRTSNESPDGWRQLFAAEARRRSR